MNVTARSCCFLTGALVVTALNLLAHEPTIPPTVTGVAPHGLMRGSTAILTLEGRSLAGARSVLFGAPGFSAKVLSVRDLPEDPRPKFSTAAPIPLGPRQEIKLEVTAAPEVEPGLHRFRVETPLGTSNLGVLEVGALKEIQESEPNNSLAESQQVELPGTLVGSLGWAGDVDSFQFSGKAGRELVFQVVAASLGSALRSILVLQDSMGKVLARVGDYSRQRDSVLTFKLLADGKYRLSVSDLERRGGDNYFYRLNAGDFPYLAQVFPLGIRAGETVEVSVKGSNLAEVQKVSVRAPSSAEGWRTIPIRVKTSRGESVNSLRLAVGNSPETMEAEPNDDPMQAQPIIPPVTINGRLYGSKKQGLPDADYFRFVARKGQRLTVEVAAARLGSPLDSMLEVLDANGSEIPQATIRCLAETTLNLFDRDSRVKAWRLASIAALRPNDYLMSGEELIQIDFLPDQPDEDVILKGFKDERFSLQNTSPQMHPLNAAVYKVEIHEPGKEFPPNGLPLYHLTARNDDGGPGYGQDSRLVFIAPEDGEYRLRLKDVRDLEGEDFAYRLMVYEPSPDFTLAAEPASPNVPRGGRTPINVTVNRRLGYDGPIDVELTGLPKDITATASTIPAGQESTVVVLQAAPDAELESPAPIQIVGRAKVEGRERVRVADAELPLHVVSVMPPPDVSVAAEPREVILEPGKIVPVTLRVERKNNFQGRVPCNAVNLPPGVSVDNTGLNGVLVTENETTRTFALRAEDWAPPIEQTIYVVATVESNAPTTHASAPLILKVRPKKIASAGAIQSTTQP